MADLYVVAETELVESFHPKPGGRFKTKIVDFTERSFAETRKHCVEFQFPFPVDILEFQSRKGKP